MRTDSTRTKFMEHIGSKEKKIRNISEFYAKNSLPLNATEQGIQNILKPSSDIAEGHVSKLKEDGTIEKTSVSGDSFLGQLLNRYAALYPQNTGNNLNNQNFVDELVKDIYFVIKNEHNNLLMAGYDLWESPEALRKILNDYTAMIMDPVSPGQQKTVVGFKDKVTGKVLNSMDLLNAIKPLQAFILYKIKGRKEKLLVILKTLLMKCWINSLKIR